MTEDKHLTDEEARRLWARATELQAQSARRREEAQAGTSDAADAQESAPVPEGYALTHVRAAAEEAGIGGEYVTAALRELRAEQAIRSTKPGRFHRLTARFLDADSPDIIVRKVIAADAETVYRAMERVLPAEPYRLTLKGADGDPVRGGTLSFEGSPSPSGHARGFSHDLWWSDIRQVHVTLTPLENDPPACLVTARSPVSWAYAINFGLAALFTASGGVGGAILVTAGTVGVLSFLGLGMVPVAAVALAALGGAGSAGLALEGYRALYRYGRDRGERALEGMLGAVSLDALGGWGRFPKPS